MNKTSLSNKTIKSALLIAIPVLVIIAIVIAVCILLAPKDSTFSAEQDYMYESEDEIYEYFSTEIENTFDLSEFDDEINGFIKNYDSMYVDAENFAQVVDSSKPVPDKVHEYIDNANEMIVEYFDENFDISVSDKIDELTAVESDFRAIGGGLGGVYATEGEGGADGKTVFLSQRLVKAGIKGEDKIFYSTYIHEVIHYLGAVVIELDEGSHDDYIWTYFSDGVAEAITSDIISSYDKPKSRPNRYISAYENPSNLVMQMYTANDELISLIFDRDDFITVDEIELYFNTDDCVITAEEIAKSITISEINGGEESLITSQYYIGEYCKAMDPFETDKIKIANCFITYFSNYID